MKIKDFVDDIIKLTNKIMPNEVQINTPLRPCKIKPLSEEDLAKIKQRFQEQSNQSIKIVSVYDNDTHPKAEPISDTDTMRRRGKNI